MKDEKKGRKDQKNKRRKNKSTSGNFGQESTSDKEEVVARIESLQNKMSISCFTFILILLSTYMPEGRSDIGSQQGHKRVLGLDSVIHIFSSSKKER